MKFVSKNSNLLVVLRQGIPGSHITGTPSKPMISARFKDGMFESSDQDVVTMLLAHPGFDTDYISTEETHGLDPFAYMRESAEPEHTVTQMKYGQPIGSGKLAKPKFPPEVMKALQEQAMEMAKAMAPVLAAEYLKNALAEKKATDLPSVVDEQMLEENPVLAENGVEVGTPILTTPKQRGRPKKTQ